MTNQEWEEWLSMEIPTPPHSRRYSIGYYTTGLLKEDKEAREQLKVKKPRGKWQWDNRDYTGLTDLMSTFGADGHDFNR